MSVIEPLRSPEWKNSIYYKRPAAPNNASSFANIIHAQSSLIEQGTELIWCCNIIKMLLTSNI